MSRRNHHGGEPGNGIIHDFSVNLNPLGPPEAARQAILSDPDCLIRYPDPACGALRDKLSSVTGVPPAHIVCGSGASDLIYRISAACGFGKVLLVEPSFSEYERALRGSGCEISYIITDHRNGFVLQGEYLDCGDGYDAIFVSNPVNPSGSIMDTEEIDRLLSWCQETDTVLVLDECFLDFVNPKKIDYAHRFFRHYVHDDAAGAETDAKASRDDSVNVNANASANINVNVNVNAAGGGAVFPGADGRVGISGADGRVGIPDDNGRVEIPDVIAIRSLTKIYALAGLRIGYALFTDRLMAESVDNYGPPWAVSGPAQAAGIAALEAGSYLEKTRSYTAMERAFLMEGLRQSGLETIKSETNFILFRGPKLLGRALLEEGIRVRDCSDFIGLSDRGGLRYYRVGVQLHPFNEALVEALPGCLEKSRRAVSVMIQGTMSNAGKSLIAAGLCRIFAQDGYRTAPFKSQNMALNSFITVDGKEIGRAQAVQAEAAGIPPSGDMNPVLLKPTTDEGSQVIVNGLARGNMKAADYFKYKKKLLPEIMEAYDRLASEQDVIVIEGAGSPVEMNLLEGDIVNMGLAEKTDSPVILVGDIDRGGVFAQLAGTMDLLKEEERQRVIGIIINKFRGDPALFESGRVMLEELCGVPVLGVVPYMDLDIDDEDSLSERLRGGRTEAAEAVAAYGGTTEVPDAGRGAYQQGAPGRQMGLEPERNLIICAIRFPRISNFSDLTALGMVDGVELRYVDRPEELDDADAIILPGTKSTISDLKWMNERGLSDTIWLSALSGVPVIGICGGFQMLGRMIRDPFSLESGDPEIRGIGLLPIETDYEEAKVTRQIGGSVAALDGCMAGLQGAALSGYEIHMGRTSIVPRRTYDGGFDPAFSGLDADLLAASWNDELNGEESWMSSLADRYRPGSGGEAGAEDITPFCQLEDGSFDGCVCGNVIGTYMHGLFDSAEFTGRFLNILADRAGDSRTLRKKAISDISWIASRKEKETRPADEGTAGAAYEGAARTGYPGTAGTAYEGASETANAGSAAVSYEDVSGTGYPGAAGATYEGASGTWDTAGRTFVVPDYEEYRQKQYDLLADGLRASLDIEKLYCLIGLEEDRRRRSGELPEDFAEDFQRKLRKLGKGQI